MGLAWSLHVADAMKAFIVLTSVKLWGRLATTAAGPALLLSGLYSVAWNLGPSLYDGLTQGF